MLNKVGILHQKRSNKDLSKADYRRDIDGLRALAVIAVIVNHFNEEVLPGGYLGVDIFFCISGYVITASLASRQSSDIRTFIWGFYERRIRRLLPALTVFLLISGISICLVDENPVFSLRTGLAAQFGLSNVYLLKQSTDYFSDSTRQNIFTHTWSLGVEEQFYVIYPILVWWTGFAAKTKRSNHRLAKLIGGMTVASMIYFIWLYRVDQPAAYFLMPTRFWEMAIGCLSFLIIEKRIRSRNSILMVPTSLTLLVMVGVMFLPARMAVGATIAVVMCSALLLCSLRKETMTYNALTKSSVTYIGLISYSLYLWHWAVLTLSRWTIGIHWWTIPFQVALMFCLASVSYNYIETPVRKKDPSMKTTLTILLGVVSGGALLLGLNKTIHERLYLGDKGIAGLEQTGTSSLLTVYRKEGFQGRWEGEKCVITKNDDVGKVIEQSNCTIGNMDESSKGVLVIGDSFSTAFVQAFAEIGESGDYAFRIVSSFAASPVKEVPNNTPWDRASKYYWDLVVPKLIQNLRKGDVVLAINDLSLFAQKDGSNEDIGLLVKGLETLSQVLREKGVKLAFMYGIPNGSEAKCSPSDLFRQWFQPRSFILKDCTLPNKIEVIRRREQLGRELRKLEEKDKIILIDLLEVFCPREKCSYRGEDQKILYRDAYSHPSVEAARLSIPRIKEGIDKAANKY